MHMKTTSSCCQKVVLAWRKLRNGTKSYYLNIRYGERGEHRCCEALRLYCAADAPAAEAQRIIALAKAVKCRREEELRRGTFTPKSSAGRIECSAADRYMDFMAKKVNADDIPAVRSELRRNSMAKEPVRIRFRRLSGGSMSVYLAINTNGRRVYEYLKLYLVPETDAAAREQNRQTMSAVYAIKAERTLRIINRMAGIRNDSRIKIYLSDWLDIYRDRQLSKGRLSVRRWVRTVQSALDGYKAGKAARLADIDRRWIAGFMAYLMSKHMTGRNTRLSKGTVDNYLRCLKAALNVAVEEEILSSNPLNTFDRSHLAGNTAEREFLTVGEVKKLIATPCRIPSLKAAFLFSCFCGLRISDVRRLKWENIISDCGKTSLRIVQSKTGRPLILPLNRQALRWMPGRGLARDEDSVFQSLTHNMAVLASWAREAGIQKHVTFHVARHTFATMALTMGADIYTTSKLLGHTEVRTTQIYAKIVNSKKEEAVSLLDAPFE